MPLGGEGLTQTATAQGIIAQGRTFGSSLGIAVSSAILARKAQAVDPSLRLALFHGAIDDAMPPEQLTAIREIYANAFKDDMLVGVAMAAAAVICTGALFARQRRPVLEQRAHKIGEEAYRRRQLAQTQPTDAQMAVGR